MGNVEQLWQQYSDRRSQHIRHKLIESYAPLARFVVDRQNLRTGPALEYEDLVGQAVVGLIDAVDRFDPSRGVKFETYAYYRIRGAVMDMLRDLDWIPRSTRHREGQLADAVARLEEQLGRLPTDDEVANELGLGLDQLDALNLDVASQSVQSLDDKSTVPGWDGGPLGDQIADESAPSPEEETERWAEREMLANAIEALPESERTVINLYYYGGMTLRAIGNALRVTESRACQIHGKALSRLRTQVQSLLSMPENTWQTAGG